MNLRPLKTFSFFLLFPLLFLTSLTWAQQDDMDQDPVQDRAEQKQWALDRAKLALDPTEWKKLYNEEDWPSLNERSRIEGMVYAAQLLQDLTKDEPNKAETSFYYLHSAQLYRNAALELGKIIHNNPKKREEDSEALLNYTQWTLFNLTYAKTYLHLLPENAVITTLHKTIENEFALLNQIEHANILADNQKKQEKEKKLTAYKVQQEFIDDTDCHEIKDGLQRNLCLEVEHAMGDRECPDSLSSSLCHIILNAKTKNCSYLEGYPVAKSPAFIQCKGIEQLITENTCPQEDKVCSRLQQGVGLSLTRSCKDLVDPEAVAICLGVRNGLGLTRHFLEGKKEKSDKRLFMTYSCDDPVQANPDFRVPLFKSIQELKEIPCQICRQPGCQACDEMDDSGSFVYQTDWGYKLWNKMHEMNFSRGLDRGDIDTLYQGLRLSLISKKDPKIVDMIHQGFVKRYLTYLFKQHQVNDLRQMFVVGKWLYDQSTGKTMKSPRTHRLPAGALPAVIKTGFDDSVLKWNTNVDQDNKNRERFEEWIQKEEAIKQRKKEDEAAKASMKAAMGAPK